MTERNGQVLRLMNSGCVRGFCHDPRDFWAVFKLNFKENSEKWLSIVNIWEYESNLNWNDEKGADRED